MALEDGENPLDTVAEGSAKTVVASLPTQRVLSELRLQELVEVIQFFIRRRNAKVITVYNELSLVSFVVEELKAVFDPRGGAWMNGKYIPSILAAIGGVLERHMIQIGFLEGEGLGLKSDPTAEVVNLPGKRGPACPACGQYDMRMVEGCMTCVNCGHSKCG